MSYSENIWGVKNDFFFQMELEKRVCGLIWCSLLFLYHIDPYLSPEPFHSFISTLDQKLVRGETILKLQFMKISHLVGGCGFENETKNTGWVIS